MRFLSNRRTDVQSVSASRAANAVKSWGVLARWTVNIPLDDDPALMAPPRPGAGDELGVEDVWGVEGGVVDEALGAQALELPIVIWSSAQVRYRLWKSMSTNLVTPSLVDPRVSDIQ